MQIKQGTFCPLLQKDCIENKCSWFICVRGVDNNTGKDVDDWGCAVAWLPMLMINTANESRKTCAATESFRNEMVQQNEQTKLLLQITQKQPELIEK